MSNEQPGEPAPAPQAATARPSRRPSLSLPRDEGPASVLPVPTEPPTSILHALSSTMQTSATPSFAAEARPARWKPWAAALGAAAALAAAWAAWLAWQSDAGGAPPLRDTVAASSLTSSTKPAAVSSLPAVASTPATAASAAAPALAASSASLNVARIEDVPASASLSAGGAPVEGSREAPAAPVVAVPRIAATAETPSAAPTAPLAAAESRREAARRPAKDAKEQRETRETREGRNARDVKLAIAMMDAREAPSPAAGPRSPAPGAGSGRPDSDVDLMAALLDHMAATESAGRGGANAAARKASLTAPAALTASRPTTISGLVASCRQAGDKRAVSECRKRICKGYWGKAEACPARLAPTAAAKKRSNGG